MAVIIGTKIEMRQKFSDDGTVVPVTVVQAGPCTVTQVKTKAKDGVDAIQLGFRTIKKASKPLKGHLHGLSTFRTLKEFRVIDPSQYQRGQVLTAETFPVGAKVAVVGTTKGQGFQGVVKRHGFHGSPASHGHKDQLRMPGSIGSTGPQRVLKGRRMAGHMGNERATIRNLVVVEVNPKENLILLKGAVPGARNGTLSIRTIE